MRVTCSSAACSEWFAALNVHASRIAIRLHLELYSGTHRIIFYAPSQRCMTESTPQAGVRPFDGPRQSCSLSISE